MAYFSDIEQYTIDQLMKASGGTDLCPQCKARAETLNIDARDNELMRCGNCGYLFLIKWDS